MLHFSKLWYYFCAGFHTYFIFYICIINSIHFLSIFYTVISKSIQNSHSIQKWYIVESSILILHIVFFHSWCTCGKSKPKINSILNLQTPNDADILESKQHVVCHRKFNFHDMQSLFNGWELHKIETAESFEKNMITESNLKRTGEISNEIYWLAISIASYKIIYKC